MGPSIDVLAQDLAILRLSPDQGQVGNVAELGRRVLDHFSLVVALSHIEPNLAPQVEGVFEDFRTIEALQGQEGVGQEIYEIPQI